MKQPRALPGGNSTAKAEILMASHNWDEMCSFLRNRRSEAARILRRCPRNKKARTRFKFYQGELKRRLKLSMADRKKADAIIANRSIRHSVVRSTITVRL